MVDFRFEVDGPILAWMRPSQGGRRRFDPPKQVAYKRMVAILCQQAMRRAGARLIEGPVSIGVAVFYPQFQKRTVGEPDRVWKESVPDYDNIVKNIKDSLKGIAWNDDAQVAHMREGGKVYLPGWSVLKEFAIIRISDAPESGLDAIFGYANFRDGPAR